MSFTYPTLAGLKWAVTMERDKAQREARRNCGKGFLQSRGVEIVYANGKGEKLNDGGTDYWGGKADDLRNALDDGVRRYGATLHAIYFEGGWNWAASMNDLRDGNYDPLVSEWALKVWEKS